MKIPLPVPAVAMSKPRAMSSGMSKRTSYGKNYRLDVHIVGVYSADGFLLSADASARTRVRASAWMHVNTRCMDSGPRRRGFRGAD
jgi:hypothetical protein